MMHGKRLAFGFALGVVLGGVGLATAAPSELVYSEPSLLFGSSFESGTLVHGNDWNISGNEPTITSQKARAGRYAVKSYLHRYDSHVGLQDRAAREGSESDQRPGYVVRLQHLPAGPV